MPKKAKKTTYMTLHLKCDQCSAAKNLTDLDPKEFDPKYFWEHHDSDWYIGEYMDYILCPRCGKERFDEED